MVEARALAPRDAERERKRPTRLERQLAGQIAAGEGANGAVSEEEEVPSPSPDSRSATDGIHSAS